MAKLTLSPLSSGYRSLEALNANFQAISDAFDNTVSRDGTSPNSLTATLDVNSQRLINLPSPTDPNDAARLVDVQTGQPGPTGAPGSKWYVSSGAPSDGTGVNGDLYLNSGNGHVFQKASGTWGTFVSNLTGPAGAGSGDMSKSENLAGLADYPTARANLSLVPGTNVQAWSAKLDTLAAQTWGADTISYQTGGATLSTTALSAFARTLIDDTSAANAIATLGAVATTDARFNGFSSVATHDANYTFAAADAGAPLLYHASATPHAWTFPPNASVAIPVGSCISFVAGPASGNVTLTRGAGVTLIKAGTTSSANVVFAAGGWASAVKVLTDTWVVSGVGLT